MAYSNGIRIDDEITKKIIDTATDIVNEFGVDGLTVRSIIQKLHVSNRVFYNRFRNIRELLETVYEKSVLKMHEVLKNDAEYDGEDYIEFYAGIFADVLKMTYIHKKQFSHFMFEHDSLSEENRKWWVSKLKRIIDGAIKRGLIRSDINTEYISYSIWCFCRGFNTDAVNRKIPLDTAIKMYSETFSIFLKGLQP